MRHFRYKQYKEQNPLASIFAGIFAIGGFLLSLALGFFFFLGLVVIIILVMAILKVRTLWKSDSFQYSSEKRDHSSTDHPSIIEGEFKEVDRD